LYRERDGGEMLRLNIRKGYKNLGKEGRGFWQSLFVLMLD
jgi:hypothetical protein